MAFDIISNLFRRFSHDARLLAESLETDDAAATQVLAAVGKNHLASALNSGDDAAVRKALSDVNVDTSQPDQWNRNDGGRVLHNVGTGPSEAASGDGAFKMVPEYSTFAAQSALVQGYADLSRRLESMETAVKAIAQYIAKANGESFPSDNGGHNGGAEHRGDEEDESRKNGNANSADSDDDDDESVKSALRGDGVLNMDIRGLMSRLMRKTDAANRTVVSPPTFMKADSGRTRTFDDALADVRDDSLNYDTEDSIRVASLRNAIALFNSGKIDGRAFAAAKSRAGTKAREALGLSEAA